MGILKAYIEWAFLWREFAFVYTNKLRNYFTRCINLLLTWLLGPLCSALAWSWFQLSHLGRAWGFVLTKTFIPFMLRSIHDSTFISLIHILSMSVYLSVHPFLFLCVTVHLCLFAWWKFLYFRVSSIILCCHLSKIYLYFVRKLFSACSPLYFWKQKSSCTC